MNFLEVFNNATQFLLGIYYPKLNLVLQKVYEITEVRKGYANDEVFKPIVFPILEKFKNIGFQFHILLFLLSYWTQNNRDGQVHP